MVVTRLTPVKRAEKPVKAMARIHRSGPEPGEKVASDRGAYPTQPKAAAPPAVRNPSTMVIDPLRYSQYDRAFRRGKAMSGAPTWRGTMKLARPPKAKGPAKRYSIRLPC